jgi:hypothetical protein
MKTPTVHYRIYNSPPMEPILSPMNQIYVLNSYIFKVHFNIILPFTLIQNGFFLSEFPTKILYAFLIYPSRATYPIDPTILDLILLTFGGQEMPMDGGEIFY